MPAPVLSDPQRRLIALVRRYEYITGPLLDWQPLGTSVRDVVLAARRGDLPPAGMLPSAKLLHGHYRLRGRDTCVLRFLGLLVCVPLLTDRATPPCFTPWHLRRFVTDNKLIRREFGPIVSTIYEDVTTLRSLRVFVPVEEAGGTELLHLPAFDWLPPR